VEATVVVVEAVDLGGDGEDQRAQGIGRDHEGEGLRHGLVQQRAERVRPEREGDHQRPGQQRARQQDREQLHHAHVEVGRLEASHRPASRSPPAG